MAVSKRARAAWKRLKQSYGTQLEDAYGEAPPPDWCRVIDRTDPDRLDQALVKIRQVCIHCPPTLGQFEAAIHAMNTLSLCRHQTMLPWHYFGRLQEGGERYPIPVTNGVTIPACRIETCRGYGGSHRILAAELP